MGWPISLNGALSLNLKTCHGRSEGQNGAATEHEKAHARGGGGGGGVESVTNRTGERVPLPRSERTAVSGKPTRAMHAPNTKGEGSGDGNWEGRQGRARYGKSDAYSKKHPYRKIGVRET